MLKIDDEFRTLIPPLTYEEFSALEDNILKNGCMDAITIWNDTIIDGHNRYEICTKHDIPFRTVEKDFDSRDDAIVWMIDRQFARRNLSDIARIELAKKKTESLARLGREKKSLNLLQNDGDRFVKNDKSAVKNLTNLENSPGESIDTRKEVAKLAGVSTGKVAQLDSVKKYESETGDTSYTDRIRSGELSIGKAYNAMKLEKKKQEILEAERSIAEEASDEYKPVLYIGDCRDYEGEYDLLLTDPPYSTDVDDIEDFVDSWLYDALVGIRPTGFGYVFIGAYPDELRAYLNADTPPHIELSQVLIWTYKNTLGNNPKDRYKQNYQACLFYRGKDAPDLDCPITNEQWAVQEINAPDGRQGDRYHAWQKPMEIAERFIRHTTKKDMTVFDGFACTGTFLLAAAKLGRKAIGYEIDEENAKIAFDRGCIDGRNME